MAIVKMIAEGKNRPGSDRDKNRRRLLVAVVNLFHFTIDHNLAVIMACDSIRIDSA